MLLRAVSVTAALLAVGWHTPAWAAVDVHGPLCGFESDLDPGSETPDNQFGTVHAGPVTVVDTGTSGPGGGVLTCTVKAYQSTHDDVVPGSASVSAQGTGAVEILPTPVGFYAPANEDVSFCTRFEPFDGSGTLYWEANVGWTWDPTVACDLAIEWGSGTGPKTGPPPAA
jgi:hypothetical protein